MRLKDLFEGPIERLLVETKGDTRTLGLLVVGAALRPSVLAPNASSLESLKTALSHIDGGLSCLRDLSRSIASFADQHVPFDREAAHGTKYWSQTRESIIANANQWLAEAPHKNMVYGPASDIWKDWLGKKGRISDPMTVVVEDRSSDADRVRSFIETFENASAVKREIARTQKSRSPIQAAALRHLCDHTLCAVRIAQLWLDFIEGDTARPESFAAKKTAELIRNLKQFGAMALDELSSFPRKSQSEADAALACACAVEELMSLFSSDSEAPYQDGDADLEWYLLEPELFVDRQIFSFVGTATEGFDLALKRTIENLGSEPLDLVKAFELQLHNADFVLLEKISDRIAKQDSNNRYLEELDRQRTAEMADAREQLASDLRRAQREVEEAVINNVLREAVRAEYVGKLQAIDDLLTSSRPFAFADTQNRIAEVRKSVSSAFDTQLDTVRNRLGQLGAVDEQSKERILELLNSRDIVTAEDYLGRLLAGTTIPERQSEVAGLGEVVDHVLFPLEKTLEDTNLSAVSRLIKSRKPFGGLSFENLRGATTDRYSEAISVWSEIRASRKASGDQIAKILTVLGFVVLSPPEKLTRPPYSWFNVQTRVIADRQICTSPAFGSLAAGSYQVLCIFDALEESQIFEAVGDTLNRQPILVFFFRRLSMPRRRNVAALSLEKRRSFLLIDEVVAVSLSASDNPLRALFSLTLPFTFSEPYMPTSSMVPREMFFGRKEEMDSVRDPRGTNFIFGGRQLGKTVLLREVERLHHSPEEGRIAVWMDLRDYGIGYGRVNSEIWSSISVALSKFGIVPPNETQSAKPDKLRARIISWLEADSTRSILLMLDEADKFLESDGNSRQDSGEPYRDSAFLKGIMETTERRFKVVFSGLHNVQRTTRLGNHPLAHLGTPRCIGPLIVNDEAKEAEALVKIPLEAIGYSIERDLVYRVLALSNYYPSLIQLFCQELIKYLTSRAGTLFSTKDGPPRVITSRHIEDAYRNENLRQAIRDRFVWTLQLDPRYEVIAYAMAYEHQESKSHSDFLELGVGKIRDLCFYWWHEGFEGDTSQDLEVLADEMVGLGILKKNLGRYSFRNSNILRLIGTTEQIGDMLVQMQGREPPIQFTPAVMRDIRLADGRFSVSTISTQQEAILRRRRSDVHLLITTPLASENTLYAYLDKWFRGSLVVGSSYFSEDPTSFTRGLRDAMVSASDGVVLVLYDATIAWGERHVALAQQVTRSIQHQERSVHVLFVADVERVWQLTEDNLEFFERMSESDGDGVICPLPAHDEAVRFWIEEQPEFSSFRDPELRKRMIQMTGAWPTNLDRFRKDYISAEKKFEGVESMWSNPRDLKSGARGNVPAIGLRLGTDRYRVLEKIMEMNDYGEYSADQLDALVPQELRGKLKHILNWAVLIGFVRSAPIRELELDPYVAKVLGVSGASRGS